MSEDTRGLWVIVGVMALLAAIGFLFYSLSSAAADTRGEALGAAAILSGLGTWFAWDRLQSRLHLAVTPLRIYLLVAGTLLVIGFFVGDPVLWSPFAGIPWVLLAGGLLILWAIAGMVADAQESTMERWRKFKARARRRRALRSLERHARGQPPRKNTHH